MSLAEGLANTYAWSAARAKAAAARGVSTLNTSDRAPRSDAPASVRGAIPSSPIDLVLSATTVTQVVLVVLARAVAAELVDHVRRVALARQRR